MTINLGAAFNQSRRLRSMVLAFLIGGCLMSANAVLASPLSALFGQQVTGSGTIKQQVRDLGHFHAVSLDLPANVELRQGNMERVTIETDDNILPLIETVIENGVLKLRTGKDASFKSTSLTMVVEVKNIANLSLGGSGFILADKLEAPELAVSIGGSGHIQIKALHSNALSISLGGSGGFNAAGIVNMVSSTIGGSGTIRTEHLEAKNVSVTLGGSGQAIVWAKDALSLNIAGSGSVGYYGDPTVSKTVFGSGHVTRLGAAAK